MLYEIKHRWIDAVLFSLECGSLRICVEAAVKARASLAGADLAGASLVGADLAYANLAYASLAGADLAYADLAGASLVGASLAGADLAYASLAGADLAYASLAGADLAYANLVGADEVDAGHDRRGFRFRLWRTPNGGIVYRGGCHTWKRIEDALAHYSDSYASNGDRAECIARLTLLRDEAARRWPAGTTQEAAS